MSEVSQKAWVLLNDSCTWRLLHLRHADRQLLAGQILSSRARHVGLCLQDNIIHGRFLAELTQEVVSDLEVGRRYCCCCCCCYRVPNLPSCYREPGCSNLEHCRQRLPAADMWKFRCSCGRCVHARPARLHGSTFSLPACRLRSANEDW